MNAISRMGKRSSTYSWMGACTVLLIAVLGQGVMGIAIAQESFPSRPIRLIVGLAPGGMADQAARLLAPGLSRVLGQPVLVENRVGANGSIAARQVADAPADGYTLMVVLDGSLIVGPAMNPVTPFDPVKDFRPLFKLIEAPLTIVAHPGLTATTLADLLRERTGAKNATTTITTSYHYGSAGIGSSGHLAGEYLKQLSGLPWQHVAYKGAADAMRDTLSGQIPLMIASVGTSLAHVRAGKLKSLAVTSPQRLSSMPEVPTVAELASLAPTLKDFNVQAWAALVAPAALPQALSHILQDATAKALAEPQLAERFAAIGAVLAPMAGAALARQIETELVQWRQVISRAQLRSE